MLGKRTSFMIVLMLILLQWADCPGGRGGKEEAVEPGAEGEGSDYVRSPSVRKNLPNSLFWGRLPFWPWNTMASKRWTRPGLAERILPGPLY